MATNHLAFAKWAVSFKARKNGEGEVHSSKKLTGLLYAGLPNLPAELERHKFSVELRAKGSAVAAGPTRSPLQLNRALSPVLSLTSQSRRTMQAAEAQNPCPVLTANLHGLPSTCGLLSTCPAAPSASFQQSKLQVP